MNKLFRKMELKKVPFKKLLKLELPELADNVLRLLEKHNPKELQIERVFDLLVAQDKNINSLTFGYGVHPLAAELSDAYDKLLLYVSSIKFHQRVVIKENMLGTQEHASVVQFALNLHFHKLRDSKNNAIINRKVAKFLSDSTNDAELALALTTLGFTKHIDKLQTALLSVWDLQDRKAAIISQRPQETSKEIAAPIIFALKNVFKQVELSRATYPELDFTVLFNELNEVIGEYRAIVSRREASNKRKAEKRKAIKAAASIEQPKIESYLKGNKPSSKKIEIVGIMPTLKAIDPKLLTEPKVILDSTETTFANKTKPESEDDVENTTTNGMDRHFNEETDQKKSDSKSSDHLQKPGLNGDT